MAIYLPGTVEEEQIALDELTPREIVAELDKHVVGQHEAKRAVAIALRNRTRRQKLTPELAEEVMPKNIIMIGPTGVGKTEIARRLAKLANSPFLKVEASKFTEVGYVGRDVESMVRDLADLAVNMVKREKSSEVSQKAAELAEEKILNLLLPIPPKKKNAGKEVSPLGTKESEEKRAKTREKLREKLKQGKLDQRQLEIEVPEDRFPTVEIFTPAGIEELGFNFQEMFSGIMPKKTRKRKVSVGEAQRILTQEQVSRLVDMEEVVSTALERVENSGIIFVDEIDKIVGEKVKGAGPDVSREGVQRDLLPIVEGTNVMTKYGMVKTDHVLFIAAGAFHTYKPSDLIPELQGRFPIRVELDSLTTKDFVRILTEPKNSLIKQYTALLSTEGVEIEFEKDAIEEIAHIANLVNERTENIGARRLHTVMTTLLEDIMFKIPEMKMEKIVVTKKLVEDTLKSIVEDKDLSRYIL